jgi:hypothetical protein
MVAENVFNKQSRTADKGWSSSFGVEGGATNSSPYKPTMLQNISQGLALGLILWYVECEEPAQARVTCDSGQGIGE